MTQTVYKSWFSNFEPFSDGTFVETELGMIPSGWTIGYLADLIEIRYGKDHKKLPNGDIPIYGSGGLMRHVTSALYTGESVLIPRKGTLSNVMYVDEAFWTVDTMFYSIMKVKGIAKYVHQFMLSKDLVSMNAGSAVPSMTTDILNRMPIIIPPEEVLVEFEAVTAPMYQKMLFNKRENQILAELRDTLLPKLMSGEIDLSQILS